MLKQTDYYKLLRCFSSTINFIMAGCLSVYVNSFVFREQKKNMQRRTQARREGVASLTLYRKYFQKTIPRGFLLILLTAKTEVVNASLDNLYQAHLKLSILKQLSSPPE